MSGNGIIKTLRKKVTIPTEISSKKKLICHNKIIHSNISLSTKENDDNFLCQYSSELLNENIKLSGIISPFINPVPCFTVKNDNTKKKEEKISKKCTYCKNVKRRINYITNKENSDINDIDTNIDKSEKTKKIKKNQNLKNTPVSNICYRPHSPIYETKDNKLFKSENLCINDSNNRIKYELLINNNKQIITNANANNIDKNKENISKSIISCKKKIKVKNLLYYSTDNFMGMPYIFEDKKAKELEENKIKKRLIKQLGQKINVATMKIEILQNYRKNKNLKSIKKKIEYNKVYCNNDLQRLKDNYSKNINQHFNQIKYLKMRLLKCEEQYLTIPKHKEILKDEELEFKIQKMDIIEKIIILQKQIYDLINRDSTANDSYLNDDSLEEKTIKDMSFNDYSIIKDTIGVNYSNNINKAYFNEEAIYENKIIKIKPNEINMFTAKFLNNIKEKKREKDNWQYNK